MSSTIFKYLFSFQSVKVLKYANLPRDDLIYSTKYQNKMKKISQPINVSEMFDSLQ